MPAMRLLIIGGTRFVGRHIAQAALQRGHEVTLFNRGRTNPGLFRDAEHVRGDRHAGGLAALAGRRYDVVVDPTAYFPADVEAATGVPAERYVLVSSGSVYRDPVAPGSDEDAPVWALEDPLPEALDTPEAYGGLKVLCERAAEARFPGRTLVLRCGLVVGPADHTERFAYWPRRVARGGAVLAAERAQPVQFIDARDLGAWAIAAVEAGRAGVFNTVAPSQTMAELLDACAAVSGSSAEPVWAGDRFLLDHGVEPWAGLPLWLPAELAGFLAVDAGRARAAGLRTRPPAETIADVLVWDAERDPAERRDALAPEREAELLAAMRGAAGRSGTSARRRP
jgi:2'-hydroxyisoflavone reductase